MPLEDICCYCHGNAQSVSPGAWTTLTLDNEVVDTDGFHSSGASSRLTVPRDGRYLVLGHAPLRDGGFSQNRVRLRANGDTALEWWGAEGFISVLYGGAIAARILDLSAGDYVELQVFHNDGGALDCYPHAAIAKVATTAPGCQLVTGTDQTPAQNTWTALTYADADKTFDVGGMHTGASNPSRVTIPADGVYLALAAILTTDTASHGPKWLQRISKNGAGAPLNGSRGFVAHPLTYSNLSSFDWTLAELVAGDYLEHEVHADDATANRRTVSQSLFAVLGLGSSVDAAYIYRSADESLATGGGATWQALHFDSEWYDPDAAHDPATNNERISLQSGRHFVLGKVAGEGNAGLASNDGRLRLTGSASYGQHGSPGRASTGEFSPCCPFAILESGGSDYVDMQTKQTTKALAPFSNLLATRVEAPGGAGVLLPLLGVGP